MKNGFLGLLIASVPQFVVNITECHEEGKTTLQGCIIRKRLMHQNSYQGRNVWFINLCCCSQSLWSCFYPILYGHIVVVAAFHLHYSLVPVKINIVIRKKLCIIIIIINTCYLANFNLQRQSLIVSLVQDGTDYSYRIMYRIIY